MIYNVNEETELRRRFKHSGKKSKSQYLFDVMENV